MKKALLSITLILALQKSQAGVFLVDNNTFQPGVFTNIPDAIIAASPGDTIMVKASPASYGLIIIDKYLCIVGEG